MGSQWLKCDSSLLMSGTVSITLTRDKVNTPLWVMISSVELAACKWKEEMNVVDRLSFSVFFFFFLWWVFGVAWMRARPWVCLNFHWLATPFSFLSFCRQQAELIRSSLQSLSACMRPWHSSHASMSFISRSLHFFLFKKKNPFYNSLWVYSPVLCT